MNYTAIHEHVCLSQRPAYRRNHLPRNPERCMCATFVTRFSLPRVIWGDTKTLFIVNPPALPVKYAADTYRRDYLRKHHTRKHPVKKYDIPCTYTYYICQKSFHYQGNYRKHLKTHQPTVAVVPSTKAEEPVHDLQGDSRACLPVSTASLSEEPPPNICDKMFSSKSHLKRHQDTIHRQPAGFSCQVCSRHLQKRLPKETSYEKTSR